MSRNTMKNEWDKDWGLDDHIIHLNHAAVAPWPLRTKHAINAFVQENISIGSQNYLQWFAVEIQLRQRLAQLINAPSVDDIALLKNTSEGLSVIAYGLEWNAGDNIVISNEEFPSNRIVWESLVDKFGVEVRYADLKEHESPEDALISCCDKSTKLLSISSVQYASGIRMNLSRLGDFCAEQDILFCVDAIQSLGALAFDLDEVKADFVVADAHKWMLGPEGIALFYIREEIRDRLKLNQYGWHMVEKMGDFSVQDWDIARSARRFECGSVNNLGIHAFNASLSLILETGIDEIESAIKERIQYMKSLIDDKPSLECISDCNESRMSGILCFKTTNQDEESVYKHLQSKGVLCALRGGGIRFSPHYYTPFKKIKQAIDLAAK